LNTESPEEHMAGDDNVQRMKTLDDNERNK
jgi:hypothetical protein